MIDVPEKKLKLCSDVKNCSLHCCTIYLFTRIIITFGIVCSVIEIVPSNVVDKNK